ncbi:glycosyltransferase family 4 protein [Microbacterium sp.]|uniref:glycosyltransferase family 4 protein n=1 Tax=Microbacterium sp. TaxID=51671 RepID=UPI0033421650
MSEQKPLEIAYVSYGDSADAMAASGVPHYLRQGFTGVAAARISPVSARPGIVARLAAKLLSFRPRRADWERNYLHGSVLPRMRSRLRTRRLRRLAPDADVVLHVRTWYSAISVPYASFIDATVTMVRGYDDTWDLSDKQFAAETRIEGDFYRRALVVYTASRAASQSLIDDYGVAPERIVQVGAGRTLRGLTELSGERIAERIRVPNILFVGKDPVRKGLPELLEAFSEIRGEFPKATLTIVGPEVERPEYSEPGVHWHGLVADKERVSEFYAAASVFVLPAHRESYGLVVPEAMSFGLPCVVSSTGELPYLVEDGVDGAVLAEVDATHIASSIREILSDRTSYAELASAAYAKSGRFDWTHIAQTMTDDMAERLRSGREGESRTR